MVVLNNRYGAEEAARIADDAFAAVKRLGPKMAEWLDSTMLGNDPSVLYALAPFGVNVDPNGPSLKWPVTEVVGGGRPGAARGDRIAGGAIGRPGHAARRREA